MKGFGIDGKNVKEIIDIIALTKKKLLQSLLGKISYFRRFISNLPRKIHVCFPLVRLKKEQEFKWEKEQDEDFKQVKVVLINPLVFILVTQGKSLRLYVSTSTKTITSMLAQENSNGV